MLPLADALRAAAEAVRRAACAATSTRATLAPSAATRTGNGADLRVEGVADLWALERAHAIAGCNHGWRHARRRWAARAGDLSIRRCWRGWRRARPMGHPRLARDRDGATTAHSLTDRLRPTECG